MKLKYPLILGALALIPLAGLVTAARPGHDAQAERVARGKYLVGIGGCNECHTPMKTGKKGPEPDFSRLLSGHPENAQLPPPPKLESSPWFAGSFTAWVGPWGMSYSANLTPDRNTGIGIWSEDIFIKAMRTGKHFGVGRDILPPMPWQSVAQLTDADLKAVYAYLRTIPPIKNRVPEPVSPTVVKFE